MSAILIETETTGLDEPDVISLATTPILRHPSEVSDAAPIVSQLFKPRKPITYGAMATHHIIEDDVAAAAVWPGAWTPPTGVEYLVGHNCDFDWKAIGSPHVARICTLALSRSLWPNLDSHSMGALIYFLMPPAQARELLRNAHTADQDVYLCALVLQHILHARPVSTWHELWQASERARVPTVMPYGKHKGMAIRDVPSDYKCWLLAQKDVDPYLQKALRGEAA